MATVQRVTYLSIFYSLNSLELAFQKVPKQEENPEKPGEGAQETRWRCTESADP